MEKLSKIVTIILWALLIVSAVLVISLMVNISENEADAVMGSWINTNIIWAYILMGLGAGLAFLSGIFNMFIDRQSARKGLVSILFLGVVFVVSYLLASDALPQFPGVQKFINDGTLTPNVAKLIDTGLFATYLLLGISILAIVASPITRLFK